MRCYSRTIGWDIRLEKPQSSSMGKETVVVCCHIVRFANALRHLDPSILFRSFQFCNELINNRIY